MLDTCKKGSSLQLPKQIFLRLMLYVMTNDKEKKYRVSSLDFLLVNTNHFTVVNCCKKS